MGSCLVSSYCPGVVAKVNHGLRICSLELLEIAVRSKGAISGVKFGFEQA